MISLEYCNIFHQVRISITCAYLHCCDGCLSSPVTKLIKATIDRKTEDGGTVRRDELDPDMLQTASKVVPTHPAEALTKRDK